nr:protein disulfide-isomerase A5-like isoform X1 [Crassostrea gigas]
MWHASCSKMKFSLLWLSVLCTLPFYLGAKQSLIQEIDDLKEFKKYIKTKPNVLVVFAKNSKALSPYRQTFNEVSQEMKGKASLVVVDCGEAKKLCKNMKVNPASIELKHFKGGNFNKDYDRKMVTKSMVNFLLDPTGDIPWEEETGAEDVVHVESPKAFYKMLRKQKQPMLVMFYAPWCGFCKRMKPDFAAAATALKGQAILAGIDVDKPHQMELRQEYNITGFPTLYYFENGKKKFNYGGENNKDGILSWMKDPKPPQPKEEEKPWSAEPSDVIHLTDDNFATVMAENPSVLVMFYAPWCGHCKTMKPEYAKAAAALKEKNIDGVLAAVDATKEKKIGDQFKITGFPTVKYFKDGEFAFDFSERTEDKIVEFMKNPSEPPPPPPPEQNWADVPSDVVHLTDETFKPFLRKKKHALIMFYAPWCGHCKKAKPEFQNAAAKLVDDQKVAFCAVDCTVHQALCTQNEVTGYPTLKYFNYGKNPQNYMGGREEADFVKFMKDPSNPGATPPPPPADPPEKQWADIKGMENLHFPTASNFDTFIQDHKSALVMFYAPWCGHCKAMKPAYGEAAAKLKQEKIDGVLAAVDATAEQALGTRFNIRGYPTLKYFKNGQEAFDYQSGRSTNDLVSFMKDPKEPAPPPPPEPAWSTVPSKVNHLTSKDFKSFLKSKSSVLVMFYAPWCGHCKKAKPEYQTAADKLAKESDSKVFAAVDCTTNEDICKTEKIDGYPTIKLYSDGNYMADYNEDRKSENFYNFLKNAPVVKEEL